MKHDVIVDFAHCTFSCSKNPKVCRKLMLSSTNPCMLVIDSYIPQVIRTRTDPSETDCDMPPDFNPALC